MRTLPVFYTHIQWRERTRTWSLSWFGRGASLTLFTACGTVTSRTTGSVNWWLSPWPECTSSRWTRWMLCRYIAVYMWLGRPMVVCSLVPSIYIYIYILWLRRPSEQYPWPCECFRSYTCMHWACHMTVGACNPLQSLAANLWTVVMASKQLQRRAHYIGPQCAVKMAIYIYIIVQWYRYNICVGVGVFCIIISLRLFDGWKHSLVLFPLSMTCKTQLLCASTGWCWQQSLLVHLATE